MSTKIQLSLEQRQTYRKQGYLIFRQAYNADRVKSLIAGVERLLDRALAGECEIRWIDRERRLPNRIGNMLHPDKYDAAFAEWLDADIIPAIEAILESPIRHSLFGMLASGSGQPYSNPWHRDLCRPGDPNEAVVLRREIARHVQFNAPLHPGDHFLQIVPGSHARPSTAAEMTVFRENPNDEMPGQMTVELEPGDIVYYNANLWHRGFNLDGVLRWSMHTAFWRADVPVWAHESGQHEAMLTPGHLERMPPVTRLSIQRYLDVYPTTEPLNARD
jgi:hypothetical protein